MIQITDKLAIGDDEINIRFVRASGPGGQHVNRTDTCAQLRFDVNGSPSLPAAVKARLRRLAGRRLTETGELVIDAREHRSQRRNREEAVARLVELIRRAARPRRRRRATRPTRASVERRLQGKRRRSEVKQRRRTPPTDP